MTKKTQTEQGYQTATATTTPPEVILGAAAQMLGLSLDQLKAALAMVRKPAEQDKLLTRAEAAKMFQVSIRTIINWEAAGMLQPVRITTHSLRYRSSDLQRLLDGSNGKAA
jgi:hypothetical protein